MFQSISSKPAKVFFVVFAMGCAGFPASSLADDTTTFGATAIDISENEGESLRERQAKRVQEWQARVSERRSAFRARMAERRENRFATLAKTGREDKVDRSNRRPIGGRAEDDGWTWSFSSQRKKTKDSKRVSGPSAKPKGKYGSLIAKYAKQHGVPYSLARAVVQVESTFRPNVTGGAGEIGLMQIKLATARGMGYKGSRKQLYNPATNLYWGMKYLGKAHQLAGGTTCGTILRYNAGHYAKRMNKISANYCRKVQRIIT